MARSTVIMLALFLLLLLGFAAVVTDGLLATPGGDLELFARVGGLPGAALSAHYLEPRCRLYDKHGTPLSPDLHRINYLDFVYVP